jgi:HAD superfamily hydrolase (TIGR01662 family)
MINQVVIFAGGKGTRLKVDLAKCLVKVAEEPIINYIVREFKNQGIEKFHFCLGFYAQEVIEHLKSLEINFSYTLDPYESCGTWEALKCAKPHLDDSFFVTYGDSVAFCDLEFMYWHFIESKQNCMMSVSNYKSPHSNFEIQLEQHPSIKSSNFIIGTKNCNFVEHGISIFTKDAFKKILFKEPVNFSDYFKSCLFYKVHFANANYYQINTLEDYEKVNETFKRFKQTNTYNFLDRDGTINKWDPDIYKHMKFEPIHALLPMLDNSNCVIVTNQPDKTRYTAKLSDINRMTHNARQFLIDNHKNVIFSMSCIHRDVEKKDDVFDPLRYDCECRKPAIGMLSKASKKIQISKNSIFYGDSKCDEECAKNFGLKFTKMYN